MFTLFDFLAWKMCFKNSILISKLEREINLDVMNFKWNSRMTLQFLKSKGQVFLDTFQFNILEIVSWWIDCKKLDIELKEIKILTNNYSIMGAPFVMIPAIMITPNNVILISLTRYVAQIMLVEHTLIMSFIFSFVQGPKLRNRNIHHEIMLASSSWSKNFL